MSVLVLIAVVLALSLTLTAFLYHDRWMCRWMLLSPHSRSQSQWPEHRLYRDGHQRWYCYNNNPKDGVRWR